MEDDLVDRDDVSRLSGNRVNGDRADKRRVNMEAGVGFLVDFQFLMDERAR